MKSMLTWILAPFGAIGLSVAAMILTAFVTLPASVAVSVAVRGYARRRALSDDRRARRRYVTGAVLGLAATWAWALAFERPAQADARMVLPAVALLGGVVLAQALCCVGLLRHVPRGQPAWTVLAVLLLWGGLATCALAYGMHQGGMLGAM
jgi:hypothetical protein